MAAVGGTEGIVVSSEFSEVGGGEGSCGIERGGMLLLMWGVGGSGGEYMVSQDVGALLIAVEYGVNFLRNFLFLRVSLPDPSTLMEYWSYCLTSTTIPDFSHLRGWLPV